VRTKLRVSDPISMESPVKMRTFRKSCTVVSKAAAENKQIVPISKFCVGLVSLPNVSTKVKDRVFGKHELQAWWKTRGPIQINRYFITRLQPRRLRRCFPPKQRFTSKGLEDLTFPKTSEMWIYNLTFSVNFIIIYKCFM
jgi:hypothetical protein